MMKKERFLPICVVVVLCWTSLDYVQGVPNAGVDQDKANEAKSLFREANMALSEGRFIDAYTLSEKLTREHADNPEIWLYMHLYIHTFYFLDEDFQKGMLHPTPPGIQKTIDELKGKQDKTVIDLVTLVWIGNGPGGNFSTNYLEQIIQSFPNSVWADWAETELGFAKIPGRDTVTEERSAAFYNFCTNFMKTHPNTHLMPRLLSITASARQRMSQDKAAKDESIKLYRQVLDSYPNAEYCCADARRELRQLIGESFEEPSGCSEERDRTITRFYLHSPQLAEHKKHTGEYLAVMSEATPRQPDKNVPRGEVSAVPYVLGGAVLLGVIGGLILLQKKKRQL